MRTHITRRSVLGASIAAAGTGVLAACSSPGAGDGGRGTGRSTGHGGSVATPGGGHDTGHGDMSAPDGFVSPDGKEVTAVEAGRGPGTVREVRVTAVATPLELGGGRTVRSWGYEDRLPGREVRLTAGDTLALTLTNHLPEDTSLHCHGISMRNDMDGVPGVTQPPIRPGAEFTYRFVTPHPGTYWFHPHSGVQLDRGMYAPLIVEDPKEPLSYDKEWVVLIDDWVDGVDGSTPDSVLAELRKGIHGAGHSGHGSGSGSGTPSGSATRSPSAESRRSGPSRLLRGNKSNLLGGEAGDVDYPYYLINGRTPDDPSQFTARPGDRIRLRIINAGGETAFRVALGGHKLTVTHTDGFPVRPKETDALLVAMGERYDVLVTAKDGVFPLTALAEGKNASTMAVLRTGGGAPPPPSARPAELDREVLKSAAHLLPDESVALPRHRPDRIIRIKLTGGMKRYDWAFDDKPYSPDRLYAVKAGERVRLVFINATDMWHPIHLHGHTFALAGVNGAGARKDTAAVLPHRKVTVDFDADNPGLWMLHCHNIYHSESGMMTTLGYRE
ncbi:multicopper oxidase family protein [Streptomyces sp. NPDC002889]|uniref:multicopper oxidase family protein n=1 Tax=Streptomyces sp. NPDC002889 TaxID=3364669 RepID=UPI003674F82A